MDAECVESACGGLAAAAQGAVIAGLVGWLRAMRRASSGRWAPARGHQRAAAGGWREGGCTRGRMTGVDHARRRWSDVVEAGERLHITCGVQRWSVHGRPSPLGSSRNAPSFACLAPNAPSRSLCALRLLPAAKHVQQHDSLFAAALHGVAASHGGAASPARRGGQSCC